MSHNLTIKRDELISMLSLAFNSDDEINLQELATTFAQSQSRIRTELHLESLINSVYLMHSTDISEEVTLPIDVLSAEDLAVPLVKLLNEGTLLKHLEPNQIVLYSNIPEIIEEVLLNGSMTPSSEYSPENIKLAIYVVEDDFEAEMPSLFDDYDCTKIRIVI